MAVKELVGLVVSDKMQKTVVVAVENRSAHSKYGKVVVRTKKYKAHDEENQCKAGDRVRIQETRPLSRTKCWQVAEIFEIKGENLLHDASFDHHQNSDSGRTKQIAEEKPFLDKIDSYILFNLGINNKKDLDDKKDLETKVNMFVVLSIDSSEWEYSNIPGIEIKDKLGSCLAIEGDIRTIIHLQDDYDVVYVENSMPLTISGTELSDEEATLSTEKDSHKNFLDTINVRDIQKGEKGDSAIVGIIDTGIDILHETFLNSSNTESRIINILDQRTGHEYNASEINKFIQKPSSTPHELRDEAGHGTIVSSIAAGKPSGDFGGGIAPDAKLLVVIVDPRKGKNLFIEAISYIKRISSAYGLPCAINLSLGDNNGPHDGSSPVEKFFNDNALKSGVAREIAIIKSSGNERSTMRHCLSSIKTDIPTSLPLDYISSNENEESLDLWFNSSMKIEFQIISPHQNEDGGRSKSFKYVNGQVEEHTFNSGNICRVRYVRQYSLNRNDSNINIELVRGSARYISLGQWKISIRYLQAESKPPTDKNIYGWIKINEKTPKFYFGDQYANDEMTITNPGTAENVIVVGALSQDDTSLPESSLGPTRDSSNRKPDVVALGEKVRGARSNTSNHTDSIAKSGTSLAAPQITGVVALLFSSLKKANKDFPTITNLLGYIQRSTTNSSHDWDNETGYGLFDASVFYQEIQSNHIGSNLDEVNPDN
jgi:ribosomal protein uS17